MTAERLLDLSVLEHLLGGNRALMEKFGRRFLDAGASALAEIDGALGAGDLGQLRHLGHRTRSAALTIGAQRMAEFCRQLEYLPNDTAAAAQVVGDLHAAFAATAADLHAAGLADYHCGWSTNLTRGSDFCA